MTSPRRRCPFFGRRDVTNVGGWSAIASADLKDIARKIGPVSLSGSCDVIDARYRSPGMGADHHDGGCERECRGRVSPLIGDDVDGFALLGKPQHGSREVMPERAVDPACPQNDMQRV